jgi:metal-responsive CopG/Arc/MetJ family transcriptional regulator
VARVRDEKEERRLRYSSISLPTNLVGEIEKLVDELRYWPTKTAFIREACLEKMQRYKKELKAETVKAA